MSDSDEPQPDIDAQTERTAEIDTQSVSSNYKVLGYNTTSSGTTYGVLGQVDSPDGFGLYTPNDAKIDGTVATATINSPGDTPLTLNTDAGSRALELGVPTSDGTRVAGGNVVTGHPTNAVNNSAVGVVIGGGGNDAGGNNTVGGDYATVSGGRGNDATGTNATVGGGFGNSASSGATVGGGVFNEATGENAIVPGGWDNTASGQYSFAAGRAAEAVTAGSFVWSDSGSSTFSSTATDQFLIDAAGGVGIGTDSPSASLAVSGDASVSSNASVDGDLTVGGTIERDALSQVYLGSLASINSTTETTLPFDTEVVDEPSAWDTSNYVYDCPRDGHYEVALNIKFSGPFSSDTRVIVRIREDGSLAYKWDGTAFAGEDYERSFTTTVADLTAGTTIKFTLQQNSGGSKDLFYGSAGTRASIRYLGTGTS